MLYLGIAIFTMSGSGYVSALQTVPGTWAVLKLSFTHNNIKITPTGSAAINKNIWFEAERIIKNYQELGKTARDKSWNSRKKNLLFHEKLKCL